MPRKKKTEIEKIEEKIIKNEPVGLESPESAD